MQRDWHGIDGEHSASRMEELVPLVRRLWRLHEGPVEHEGRFYRVQDPDTLEQVYREIDTLERSDVKNEEKIRYDETFQTPLLIALLILFLERILAWRVWRVVP